MELHAELVAPCPAAELFAWVEDLDRYPQWLGIVRRAEPVPDEPAPDEPAPDGAPAEVPVPDEPAPDGAPAEANPAWVVDLRAQLGPLSRAKRLRMERTGHHADGPTRLAVFERRERDGRDHGLWVLRAEVHDHEAGADGEGSRLVMALRYDGRLWGSALGAVLQQEIERSRHRLLALVT